MESREMFYCTDSSQTSEASVTAVTELLECSSDDGDLLFIEQDFRSWK